jgi:hypothetical protein
MTTLSTAPRRSAPRTYRPRIEPTVRYRPRPGGDHSMEGTLLLLLITDRELRTRRVHPAVPPEALPVEDLISFWSDDLTAGENSR